jgi:hypothetical protein
MLSTSCRHQDFGRELNHGLRWTSRRGRILVFSCYNLYLSIILEFRVDLWASLYFLWFTPFHRDFPHNRICDSTWEDLPFWVLGDFSPIIALCFPKFLCHSIAFHPLFFFEYEFLGLTLAHAVSSLAYVGFPLTVTYIRVLYVFNVHTYAYVP